MCLVYWNLWKHSILSILEPLDAQYTKYTRTFRCTVYKDTTVMLRDTQYTKYTRTSKFTVYQADSRHGCTCDHGDSPHCWCMHMISSQSYWVMWFSCDNQPRESRLCVLLKLWVKPLLLVTCQHDVGACERAGRRGGRSQITIEQDQWDYNQRGPMGLQLRRANGITTKEDQ